MKPYVNEPLQGFELKTLFSCLGPLVAVAAIGEIKPNSNTDKRASVGNNSLWQNSANFATAKWCKTCEFWCRHPWENILMDRGLVSVPKPAGFPVCNNPWGRRNPEAVKLLGSSIDLCYSWVVNVP